jgi:hypothetical protein
VNHLTVELSLVFLLGIVACLLYRYAGLRLSHALVCIMLGFYLASSSMADPISDASESLVDAIQGEG